MVLFISARAQSMEYGRVHWDWLLQHDIDPDDLAQVVTVPCHTNERPLAYDAINALARTIESGLGGRVRSNATK